MNPQYRYFGKGNHASAIIKRDVARIRALHPRRYESVAIKSQDGKRKRVEPMATAQTPRQRHEFWVLGNTRAPRASLHKNPGGES